MVPYVSDKETIAHGWPFLRKPAPFCYYLPGESIVKPPCLIQCHIRSHFPSLCTAYPSRLWKSDIEDRKIRGLTAEAKRTLYMG